MRDRNVTIESLGWTRLYSPYTFTTMPDAFDLQEETQALQDLETYEIPNEHDVYNEDPGALLEGQ